MTSTLTSARDRNREKKDVSLHPQLCSMYETETQTLSSSSLIMFVVYERVWKLIMNIIS